jgi:diguanylate cyclase (GGDEF)-like protein
MQPAILPTDEDARLDTLCNLNILDTPTEERYDRITRLVAAHFGEPYTAINMIAADRQWSKSSVGGLPRQMPRQLSFCAYAALANELMVIEDLTEDPRFGDHPQVAGPPHLRFYAAAPLRSPGGQAVGTLCIIGRTPRRLDVEARRQLTDFAALVERELNATELEAALRDAERNQTRFRAAAEANLDAFFILESLRDAQGKIVDFAFVYANSRVEQIVATPRAQILGRRLCEVLPTSRSSGFFDKCLRVIETGTPFEEEFTTGTPGRRPMWLFYQVVRLGDGLAITSRNVTDRRAAEEDSAHTNAQLQDAVRGLERRTRDIMLLNELGELLLSCRTIDEVGNVVALSLRTLLPRTTGVLYLEGADSAPLLAAATWGGYRANGSLARDSCWALRRQRVHYVSMGRGELFCRHSAAEHRCESLCIPLRSQGKILGLLHVLSMQIDNDPSILDEAQRQLAMTVAEWTSLALANLMLQHELRQQALHDPLTGLYNRRYFEQLAPQILADAATDGYPVSVIALDIDHFKQVNDRYGHATGDVVIQSVARVLATVAPTGAIICRIGGEEFLVMLPRTPSAVAAEVADRLRARAAAASTEAGVSIPAVTISAGVACYPEHNEELAHLMASADTALYRAKAAGRNRIAVAEA